MAYSTDGFEVVSLFPDFRLDGFRQAIGERMDAAFQELEIPGDLGFPHEPFGRRLERIARSDAKLADTLLSAVYHSAHLDRRIAFLDGHPALKTVAENLVGKAIRSFTIRVRANVPSLPARRQGWHSDVSILDGGEFSKVKIACWIPLSHATIHNGTLEVVPGRRDSPMIHAGDSQGHTIREEDLEGREKKAIDCSLGSAVFLDSFVPHRAIPNLSGEVRWSVVVWMMA